MLTSDFKQLATAVRPFRAIHHLREGKILDVRATPQSPEYCKSVEEKFGTQVLQVDRKRVLEAYESPTLPRPRRRRGGGWTARRGSWSPRARRSSSPAG